MGSMCGKQSEEDLPSARPSNINTLSGNATSSRPAKKFMSKQKPKITGPGRTLGGSSTGEGARESSEGVGVDARSAAAIAATNREDAAKASAKKSRQLQQGQANANAAGKKQTGADELAWE